MDPKRVRSAIISIRIGTTKMKFGIAPNTPIGRTRLPACDYFGVNYDDYVIANGNTVIDHTLPAHLFEGVNLRLAEIVK